VKFAENEFDVAVVKKEYSDEFVVTRMPE